MPEYGRKAVIYPPEGPPAYMDVYQSAELNAAIRAIVPLLNEVSGSNAPLASGDGSLAPISFLFYVNGVDEVGAVQLLLRGENEGGDPHETSGTLL